MSLQLAFRRNVIVLAAGEEKFKEIAILSELATRNGLQLLPLRCCEEVQQALFQHQKIFIVFERGYKADSQQEGLVCDALAQGADWMPLSVFEGLIRGHAPIAGLEDLLDWYGGKEERLLKTWMAGAADLLRRILAFFAMLLSLPLLLAVAVGIKVTSRGPVFFLQSRVGHRGKQFKILKFRTMHVDAEKNGPQWCQGDHDTRVFPFGRFLRKSHLDELPQLWNVVVGDLCFIGPRPERPEFHRILREHIPHFPVRVSMRPGITGWAQLRAGYAASVEDAKKKFEHDLYFMKATGIRLFGTIILQTMIRILTGILNSSLVGKIKSEIELQREGEEP
jgi:lipopolysaccharide/colanic/teichoic acid biosynthesis glycosyltransferase